MPFAATVVQGRRCGLRSTGVAFGLSLLTLTAACTAVAAATGSPGSKPGPSARPGPTGSSSAALERQVDQALRQGDLRRGCPLLRQLIDALGARYARTPSPAQLQELRQRIAQLQPCLRKGL